MEPMPRTPRRFGSRSTWLRIALAVVVIALLWSAAWFYMPPIVAAQAKDAAKSILGRELTLGRVTFQPWTLELTIEDAALAGPAAGAPPLFEAKRLHADVAITSLLRLAPIVDALDVDAPMLRVARVADDRYDVDDVVAHIAAFIAASAGKPPARYAVHNIVVRDGGADFVDRPLAATHRLRALALGVPFFSSLPSERAIRVEPHLSFTLDDSRFDTAGEATPFAERGNGELHLKIDGLAVQPYLGYLPRDLPAQPRAATLNADVVVAFEQRPKLSIKVAGSVGARDIEVVDAAAHELLKVGNVQVKIDELRPLERLVRLQSVAIDAPHVLAARDASGHVNLLLAAESPRGAAVPVARVPLPTTSASAAASDVRIAASSAASAPRRAASTPTAAVETTPWRVAVEALTLRAGRLDWNDASTTPAAALALRDVALDAQKIAWPVAAPVVFRGEAALGGSEARGKLAFSGQGDTQGAKLTVSLASLPLTPLRPYLRAVVVPQLAGELSADLDVDWRAGDGPANVRALVRSIALAQLAFGDPAAPEAAAERIEASDAKIDTRARTLAIGRLALHAPRVRIERDSVRRWAHERWTTPPGEPAQRAEVVANAASGAATAASGAASTAPWNVSLGELAVDRGRVGIADRAHAVPVAVDVSDLAVELRGFALTAASAPFHISGRIAVPTSPNGRPSNGIVGSADIRGELQGIAAGVPGGGRATLLLKDLPLYIADPYLDDVLGLDIQRAQASFKGDARWTRSTAGMGAGVKGDLTIDDFRASSASPDRATPGRGLALVRDGGGGRQLLNWKSLSLRGVEFAMAPGTATRFTVGETTLSDFFARIALDESGHLNLQDVTHPAPGPVLPAADAASAAASAAAPQASAPTVAASGPAAIIRSGPIVVVGGRINYDDRFVKPNYNANLSEVSGRLESFSSEPPAPGQPPQLADLAVKGRVEGTATLEIAGKINPLAKPLALDLKAKVRDLELPPLSPYAIKYAGYGIERGKMSVDLAYVVQPSGELTATNKIVLHQLVFGEKAEGATTTLPVKLAVALLADSHGVIDLDLPVSGSINDPHFSIGGIVWKAITNIFVKAVSAPFTLLASAFGGGSSGERSYIEFAPGTATLGDAQREALDKVAKALAERPGLTVTIAGESRLEREADAWKKERLAQLVRSEKRRQAIAASGAASAAGITVSEAEYATFLKEVYRRADIVKPKNVLGLTKDLPPAEMEALLLASMTVDNDAMQQLATRRGVAVRDYLVGRDIAAERLFLGSPKTASEEASWTPRADLKLAAS
jgi:uncharacterized protein involved in outer membrane biogenesis